MSEQKWTKEPWWVDGLRVESAAWSICDMDWDYSGDGFDKFEEQEHKAVDAANADRIVACVNALAGIPDPAAFVSRVAAMEEALKEVVRLIQQLPSGIDREAEDDNERPEDMAAHVGGMVYRTAKQALEGAGDGK